MVSRTGLIRTLITLLTVLFWTPVSTAATAQAAPAAAAADECRVLAPGASATAERAIAAACAEVAAGTWYTWGGGHGARPGPSYGQVDPTDPEDSAHDPERRGFDCSGLVRYAYAQATDSDILNGVASQQYYTHRAAERFTAAQGLAPLLPGDLLVYGTSRNLHHIAIYLGAGKMVEAKESGTKLMVSDVRLGGTYFGAVRVNTGEVTGHIHQTWGTDVWTKAEPRLAAARVYAFPYSTTIRVECQKHAEEVTSDGYTNDAWSYLPDYKAWVTNIYIKGPAWLEGVPECTS
ncbi:NlpC/P60 family protein [Streptomyces sp. NPDC057474]|uniref:NlpC/P60 family protein n=1 Tax=Streptomyces sp. NPDC057474 TaxID=3346144 RepID=UPI0036CFEABB